MATLFFSRAPAGSVSSIHFQLRRGLSGREIARDLQQHGLIRHPASFLIWVKFFGANRLRPGIYDLPTSSSGLEIYRRFEKGPPLVRVTFPEGWMARQMAALLESKGIVNATEFMKVVQQGQAEGYLFPDTYFFEQDTPAEKVVTRMRTRFSEVLPKDFELQAKQRKLTTKELVTLASMVEKEARAPAERPIIAGVFYNRLKKKMLLESCATVEYALGKWKPRLLYKDLEVKSPYNTYKHAGLPPGPICNPGAASLEAAAHPAVTDMLYFVADGQGTHRFSRYYKDHLNAKKKR